MEPVEGVDGWKAGLLVVPVEVGAVDVAVTFSEN